MKLDKLAGERFKERPTDCVTDNHALLVRGGYMKYMANGIYSSYMPLKRVMRKIEKILREEMDAIDGQEVQFPVVMPASLWQESGRYESIGNELMRMKDRNGSPLVLGMTHEEASVQLVKEYANSYTKYPFMIYQIQTKFRDEVRPRAGLIRVREFIMKDAYSFHTSQEDLEQYYEKCHQAYQRIYRRAGLKKVVSVAGDSGMMGGKISHEFMFLTAIGEDRIAICPECEYHANQEVAESIVESKRDKISEPLTLVHTPNLQSIEEVCGFLKKENKKSCKAVVYQKNEDDSYIIVFIRGDLDVNEVKLRNYLGYEIHPAEITEESGIQIGYIGPYQLQGKYTILYDRSLQGENNLICGANQEDYHYTGLDIQRDIPEAVFSDFANVMEGSICPSCKKPILQLTRGIEVGNIFQLGDKYTKTMGMHYLDKNGKSQIPIMGCYGIGVGRLAASICEEHHDDYGPIWPITVAPWQVHICALRIQDAQVREEADRLYEELKKQRIEVIYDDRKVSPGIMFSDADLLGVPLRITISPKTLADGEFELSSRDKKIQMRVVKKEILTKIQEYILQFTKEIEE